LNPERIHKRHTRHSLIHPAAEHWATLGVIELKENDMKKLVLVVAVLFVAVSAFAGGGKSCHTEETKTVQLTGTIACKDGSTGENCAKVFQVANSDEEYVICDRSKARLANLSGQTVRVTGKVVSCDETDGVELFVEKAAKI
jgi:hypothetical protein